MTVNSFEKRKQRVRAQVKKRNKSNRPIISVYKSNKNIYAQLIDTSGKVIKSYSSMLLDEKEVSKKKGVEIAKLVGSKFAKLCVEVGVKEVAFDKGAYLYNGRIKALAESCREAGLKF